MREMFTPLSCLTNVIVVIVVDVVAVPNVSRDRCIRVLAASKDVLLVDVIYVPFSVILVDVGYVPFSVEDGLLTLVR